MNQGVVAEVQVLVGWVGEGLLSLIDQLVGWLVGQLVSWSIGRLVSWSVGRLDVSGYGVYWMDA